MLFSHSALADVVINKNTIACDTEKGIKEVANMKDFKKIRKLPKGCRTLDVVRKGKIVKANKRYVKIKPNVGSSFYTLQRWVK